VSTSFISAPMPGDLFSKYILHVKIHVLTAAHMVWDSLGHL